MYLEFIYTVLYKNTIKQEYYYVNLLLPGSILDNNLIFQEYSNKFLSTFRKYTGIY